MSKAGRVLIALRIASLALVLACLPAHSSAQLTSEKPWILHFHEPLDRNQSIPFKFRGGGGGSSSTPSPLPVIGASSPAYTSWSLFLVCNPSWLLPEKADALRALHQWYNAFGAATGRKHASVWFYKEQFSPSVDDLDIDRNVQYCKRFGLAPSQGPYLVVTTTHPDLWTRNDLRVFFSFDKRSASEISGMVGRLTDVVVAEKIAQDEIDAIAYSQSWIRVVESGCRWLAKVKFSIKAKGVEVERTGLCGDIS